jgi:nuclear transport factor 2 (NTF2) superfamily protein
LHSAHPARHRPWGDRLGTSGPHTTEGSAHERPTAAPAVHRRDRPAEGAGRRGRLEQPDPGRVALAYSEDSAWRNRGSFITGRPQIIEFLTDKWAREIEYALRKSLWSFDGRRIAVRFQYECHDRDGQW